MSGKEIPDSVKRCVAALKGAKSDNDKFASLFVVTKLIKADECDENCLKLLYQAIGFDFLNRLLKSTEVPQDCPPFIYKSIALSIVSCFCSVPEIVESPSILSIIPVLLDIVSMADTDDMEDNLMLVSDCYTCLQAIGSFEKGRKALLEKGSLEKLAEIYVEENFRHDEALNLLVYMASHQGRQLWIGKEDIFKQLMSRLANDFNGESSERKFELCRMLAVFLTNSPPLPASDLLKEEWPQLTLLNLEKILCSKIGTSHRDGALQLVARMLELFGIGWGLKFGPNPRQFLLLLVNLACVEVRMKLEDKTLDQALESADILVACYSIVELFISFMTTQGFLDFDAKQREQAYCALKGAVGAILSLLNEVSEEQEQGWPGPVNDRRTQFICASIRILGAWLSEETTSMKEEVCAVLPFIISMCSRLFEERKMGTTDLPDPLRFMLPAFCHLAAEDEPRKIMLAQKMPQLLYDYLLFQWGIFKAWLAQQPAVAADWLHIETTEEEDAEADALRPDSEPAVILVCGIFMNLAVLEPELVATDAVFAQLLKFCITHLPSLVHRQDFVVLLGNMGVLGLLLLRHHAWKFVNGDSTVFRYIQGCVSFLWDAHNSEESCDSLSLVISLRYKKDWPDLAELWFLGMQGLSNVMSKLDWIVEFIVDSGWPQEMMKSLSRIVAGAIDANTRTAYEDFLCCLVRAKPDKWEKIAHIDAGQLFDSILVSGDLNCEKPQPEIFHLACSQLNVLPEKCCMIGDRLETDILGGKLAGLGATFWIPLHSSDDHASLTDDDEPPDFTIESLMELAPIFGKNSSQNFTVFRCQLAKDNEFYPPIDPPDDPDWKKDLVVSKFSKVCMNDAAIDESLEESVSDVKEDKMFLKFKEKITSYPDQVLRYGSGEKPLWVSDSNIPTSVPECELCGSKRKFEFQIMPQMLNYLQLDSVSEQGVDWGTLLIYICENNCDEGHPYKDEYLWKQDFSEGNSV
nr:EOG090X0266 [Eurycercus lamellatus]